MPIYVNKDMRYEELTDENLDKMKDLYDSMVTDELAPQDTLDANDVTPFAPIDPDAPEEHVNPVDPEILTDADVEPTVIVVEVTK